VADSDETEVEEVLVMLMELMLEGDESLLELVVVVALVEDLLELRSFEEDLLLVVVYTEGLDELKIPDEDLVGLEGFIDVDTNDFEMELWRADDTLLAELEETFA